MTILLAVAPDDRDTGAPALAIAIARARDEDVLVVTVVPTPWGIPSMARVDAEFAEWAAERGAATLTAAVQVLADLDPFVTVESRAIGDRSPASALLDEA